MGSKDFLEQENIATSQGSRFRLGNLVIERRAAASPSEAYSLTVQGPRPRMCRDASRAGPLFRCPRLAAFGCSPRHESTNNPSSASEEFPAHVSQISVKGDYARTCHSARADTLASTRPSGDAMRMFPRYGTKAAIVERGRGLGQETRCRSLPSK